MSTIEEEDDPVVEEALADNLYIYQFPVKPANREWSDVKIVNASVKPNNQLVRLEVGLDTNSDVYCPSKGEQIALNTDGYQESSRYVRDKEKEKALYFKHGMMDKIVYKSTTPCNADKYAVAILQGKEMHCTPVKGIVQLRPAYTYFDKQDNRKKDTDNAGNSEDEEEEPEAQQVIVKFARNETDLAKKAREKSFEFLSRKASDEPWYDALWRHSETDHSELERLKLFSANSGLGSSLPLSGREYIPLLVPAPPADEADVAKLVRPSPKDQVTGLLLNAKVLSFSELRSLVSCDGEPISESNLLLALTGHACCVRGVWTARSADMYAEVAPAPAAVRQAARDHVLYLFTQHPYIDRRKVTATVRLPPAEVLEIIRSVAKFNPRTEGWELIVPPDQAFEAKYPEVCQRQNMFLEGRQRIFNEMMISETLPKRQRKKSQRDSISSDTMLSPKPRCSSVSEDDNEGRKRAKSKPAGKRPRDEGSSAQDAT